MKASARIQVTLDVPISDQWNDGTDIAEIRQAAVRSGLERLQGFIRSNGGIRVVGDPKVTIVLMEDV